MMQFYDDFHAQNITYVLETDSKLWYDYRLTPMGNWKMVSRKEIEHVAKLMRIEIDDPTIYEGIDKMIGYFDILESPGVESEEISAREIELSNLREDKHIPFGEKLIEKLNHYKGTYVRAPKMVWWI